MASPITNAGRVLVVDDHRTMQMIIAKQLRQIGFHDVDTVGDPVPAFTLLRHRRYAVILSDWNMEPMDGLAFLRAVRSDPAHARTPFIMITAEARPDDVIAAKRLGVDGYLVKPFDAGRLQSLLTSVQADALAQRKG
jgi:two-component system chemotaxis response regulator CheY